MDPVIAIPLVSYSAMKTVGYVEKSKSAQMDLSDETKKKIFEDGIYHITTKEKAIKILNSGFIAPSTGKLNNHYSRSRNNDEYADFVYMFAGKPDAAMLVKNMSHSFGDKKDGTFYAIKYTPDKFEIENYTERLQDGVITHEGKLDFVNSKPQIVRMKLEKGKLIEKELDEKVKENNIPKRIIKNSITMTKSVISTYKEIFEGATYLFSTKKRHQLKDLIAQSRMRSKLLKQYNSEKTRKNMTITIDGTDYTLSTGNDKYIDGRILSEFELADGDSEKTRRIFTEQLDISAFSEETLKSFFSQGINENTDLDQYIGMPKIENGEVTQSIDREFEEHFQRKQEIKRKTDVIYQNMTEKSKKQYGFFRKVFNSTSAKARNEAQRIISDIKTRGITISGLREEKTNLNKGEETERGI